MATGVPEGPVAMIRDINNAGLSVTLHDNSDVHSTFHATLSCSPKFNNEPRNERYSPIKTNCNKETSCQPDLITNPTQTYENPLKQTNFCNVYQGLLQDYLIEQDLGSKPFNHLSSIDQNCLYKDKATQFNGNYNYYNLNGKEFLKNEGSIKSFSRSRDRSNLGKRSTTPNSSSRSPAGCTLNGVNSKVCADRGPKGRLAEYNSFSCQDKYCDTLTLQICSEFPPQRDVPHRVDGNFSTNNNTSSQNQNYYPLYLRKMERNGDGAMENSKFVHSLRKYPENSKCFYPEPQKDIAERPSSYVRTKKGTKTPSLTEKRGPRKIKERLVTGGVAKATKLTQTYTRKYNIQVASSSHIVGNCIESQVKIEGEEVFSEQYDYLKSDNPSYQTLSQRRNLEVQYLLDILKCVKKRMRSLYQPSLQSPRSDLKRRYENLKREYPKTNFNSLNNLSSTSRNDASSESIDVKKNIQITPALNMEKSEQTSIFANIDASSSYKNIKLCSTSVSGGSLSDGCPVCKLSRKQLQEQIEAQVKEWARMLPILIQVAKECVSESEYDKPTTDTENMTKKLINTLTFLKIRFNNSEFNDHAKKEISTFINNLLTMLPNDEDQRTKLFETLSNELVHKLTHVDLETEKDKDKVTKVKEDIKAKVKQKNESTIVDLDGLAKSIIDRLMELDFKCVKDLKECKCSLESKLSDIISDLPIKLSFRDKTTVFKNSLELFSDCVNSFYPKHDKSVIESVGDENKKHFDTYLIKSDHSQRVFIKDNSKESIDKINFVKTVSNLQNALVEAKSNNKVFIESFSRKVNHDIYDKSDKNATEMTPDVHVNNTNARPATQTPVTDDIMFGDSIKGDEKKSSHSQSKVLIDESQKLSDQKTNVSAKTCSEILKMSNQSLNLENIQHQEPSKSQVQCETKPKSQDKERCSSSARSSGLTKSASLKIDQFQKKILDQVECLLKKYSNPDQITKLKSGNSITDDFINKVKDICESSSSDSKQLKELRLKDEISRYMNNFSLKSDTSKETLVCQLLKSLEEIATSKDKNSKSEGSNTSCTTPEFCQEIRDVIEDWINCLQIRITREQKEIIINEMAKELFDDITLRRKYKQIYEKNYPKTQEDDISLKYSTYKLVNKLFKFIDLSEVTPKIPDLVNKLQDIEGDYVSSKEIDSDASTSLDINDLVAKLCDQLFCSLIPSRNQLDIERLKRNLTNKTVRKLKSLHDDLEIINDDLLYSSALNEELDNILGSLRTNQSSDGSKNQFKCKVADILANYKSKRCNEEGESGVSYKQELRNAIENVILSQEGIERLGSKKNYAKLELFKESILDAYLTVAFNKDKRKSETKAMLFKIIKELVSYIRDTTGKLIDFENFKTDVEIELARVSRPNNDVINLELDKLRYKEAVNEWLNTLTMINDNEEKKLERLQHITLLVKRICDLNKEKSTIQEDLYFKRIKSAVSTFWKNLRKDSNVASQTNEPIKQLYQQINNSIDKKQDNSEISKPIHTPLQSMLSLEDRALLHRIREKSCRKNNINNHNGYLNIDNKIDKIDEAQTVSPAITNVSESNAKAPNLVVKKCYTDLKSPNSFNANIPSVPIFISSTPCCDSDYSVACFPSSGLPPLVPPTERQSRDVHQSYRRPDYADDVSTPDRIATIHNYHVNEATSLRTSLEVNIDDREYVDDYTEMNKIRKRNHANQIKLDESGSSDHIYGNDISHIGVNLRPEKARGRFKRMMENSTNVRYEKGCSWCFKTNNYKHCPNCYAMECPYPSKLYFSYD